MKQTNWNNLTKQNNFTTSLKLLKQMKQNNFTTFSKTTETV